VDAYLSKSEAPATIRETIVRASKKHSAFDVVPLVTILLPKLGWVLYQALHSVSSIPLDINLL
jgi:hypothetical protein